MKTFFFLLLSLGLTTHTFSQTVLWTPEEPKAGEKVTITYNPTGTALENAKTVDAVVYLFGNNEAAREMKLIKSGNVFKGSFVTDTGTVLASVAFSSGDLKDINKTNGYMVSVRDKKGNIRPGTYAAYSMQYSGYGNFLYGLPANMDYAFNYIKQEWNEFPAMRPGIVASYLNTLYNKKKKEAEPEILQIMNDAVASGNLTETQYDVFSVWYQRFKQKDKADALKAEMKTKYPAGNWKRIETLNAFYGEADPLKKEALLQDFVRAYPAKTENDKMQVHNLYSALAGSYAEAKDESKRDIEKYKSISAKLPADVQASLYNNISWRNAEKDILLELGKEHSAIATKWAKNEVTNPTTKKPPSLTNKAWEDNRKETYAMFADTYGYIMYKLKDYKTGFPYVKEAAVDIKKKKDPEYNDRYAMLLEHVASPAEVQKELEPLVEDGKLASEGKAVLRRALVTNLKSEEKADERLAVLSKAAAEKAREELVKKMINEESVDFKLKNLEGNEVSLASLKGKVVVLDFWATWCGPCIASFPGMQKAVNKYKDNDKVAFLFIDTWENQETPELRRKAVSDFIKNNKYTFNVLYDEKPEGSVEANNHVVVTNYKVDGIPTKFIIDKNGKVRFKSVGFGGGDDALVNELSAMIELADSK